MPEECRWDDKMHDASTMGLPCPRLAGYGREVLAYRKQMTSLFQPLPSATYRNNVEHDPPKQKPWNLKPRKAKRKKGK